MKNMCKLKIAALSSGLFLLALNTHAGTIDPRLEQALSELNPGDPVPVIVRLKDTANSPLLNGSQKSLRKSQRRANLIRALRNKANRNRLAVKSDPDLSGTAAKSLWLINGVAITLPARRVTSLAAKPWIDSIVLDARLAAPVTSISPGSVPGWNQAAIRAPELWQLGYTGHGVVIASLDTGVDINHADLAPKFRGGSNSWFDPYGQYATPADTDGHGTQSMGLMVGGDSSGQVIGVAPDAQWIAAKIFDNTGMASYSAIHQAFQWALDPDGNPDVDDAPDVVNNSWGLFETVGTCFTEFADDIAMLKNADIAVVFSAGNSGPYSATSLSPANNAGSVAVGAVDSSLAIADFSSRGPSACGGGLYPQISAPGVGVMTTGLTFGGIFPQSYIEVSGTSFSVAHLAGSLALLKSSAPTASVTELEAAITQSAVDMGSAGADNDYGAGVVDVLGAYNALGANPPPPQPGQLQLANAVYTAVENGGSISITVTRTGGSSGAVSVDYFTTDGTATAGLDYQAASGSVNFADGETSHVFTIALLDDALYEGDEAFSVTLGNTTGGAVIGAPASAAVTITDNESPPSAGKLQFAAASYSIGEDGGVLSIEVERVEGSYGSVSVSYATSGGTATSGVDYEAISGTLVFADGVTRQTFTIVIADDSIYEGDERIELRLSNATGGAQLGVITDAAVTIVDQDPQILDADADGYEASADCNDNNATVYPGAPEVKRDGVDQDCNGYDLTINITQAIYRKSKNQLVVHATSDYRNQAALSVIITLSNGSSLTRTMTWNSAQNRWQRTVNNFARNATPVSVVVTGPEGAESASVAVR